MKKAIIILLLCLPFLTYSREHKYDLSICAIFRDDAPYLSEWVEFHQKQGVEHFYLYNNLSQDNFQEILRPYLEIGLVEIKEWPYESFPHLQNWNEIQCSAYNDFLKKQGKDSHWVAIIDTDEFLFSSVGDDLRNVLKSYNEFGGVAVNWVFYGTGNVKKIYPGEKMIEKLLFRAPINDPHNKGVKTIVQPKKVKNCINPHFCVLKEPFYAVTENKEYIQGAGSNFVSVNILRLNHYWQRDEEFFDTVKAPRRMKCGESEKDTLALKHLFNDEYDDIILRINH